MSNTILQGSTTGTGSVTLVAPNTNLTQTLTLPDATGTVLAEQSGNIFYKQSNILGTVSQAAGVPTGAVIERGSNANGEYVRFADGTQICYSTTPAITLAVTTGIGSDVTRSFSTVFIAAPRVTVTQSAGHSEITAGSTSGFANKDGLLTTSTYCIGCRSLYVSGTTVLFDVVAIGRWF